MKTIYVVDGARTPFLKAQKGPGPFAASDLATQAGRADLAGMTLTAALHAAHISEGRFEVYTDETGSLGTDLLSLFVTKRSGLAPVMLAAMQHIVASGEYQRVMAKWGVTAVSVQAPRMNAAQ